jgi:hypothetical protein
MDKMCRRSVLRFGGLMSGGLILPWAGSKALALAEPTTVADLAVVETPFPASAEILRFRSMITEMSAWRLEATIAQERKDEVDLALFAERRRHGTEPKTFFRTGQPLFSELKQRCDAWEAQAHKVLSRPVQSWGDVAEIAEIAWTVAPKVGDRMDDKGEPAPPGATPALRRYAGSVRDPRNYIDEFAIAANAALIDGVLTMAGGQRFDPYYDFDRRWSAYQLSL